MVNNKVYSATKVSPFMVNYSRGLRIRADIKRKGKVEKAMEVCRENEKDIRESWGSIEKSLERKEIIGREKRKKVE